MTNADWLVSEESDSILKKADFSTSVETTSLSAFSHFVNQVQLPGKEMELPQSYLRFYSTFKGTFFVSIAVL